MADGGFALHQEAETPKDFASIVVRWREELELYQREFRAWESSSNLIERRYMLRGYNSNTPQLNLLWSNIQTLLPALYSRTPEPIAQRRFKDRNPLARLGAQVIERFLANDMQKDEFDSVLLSCVKDMLLVGRGVPWVSYEGITGEVDGTPRVLEERARVEYVYWRDFAHAPLKCWDDVKHRGWVARREFLTLRQGMERFGEKFKSVPLTARRGQRSNETLDDRIESLFKVAEVWEIWDAEDKAVYWICKDHDKEPLDVIADPWGLKGFFPCPEPLYTTTANDSLVPVADYEQYRPLAMEMDIQTQRISLLTHALRVAGAYDASMPNLGQIVDDNGDVNKIIPVDNLAQFTPTGRAGSLDSVVKFMPIDTISEVLVNLYSAREQVKQLCYEITGISDIIRGQVDHREKAAQSQIKSEWAASRIDPRKASVAKMCRNIIAMKAEIMAEHFQPMLLREMSGFDYLPEIMRIGEQGGLPAVEQVWQQVMNMIRTEKMRTYQIEIETDSTVLANDQASKNSAIEYLQATAGLLDKLAPTVQAMPHLAPIMGEQLLFVARKFRAGRGLEGHLEDLTDLLERLAQQPQPDPAQAAAQAEMEMEQQKHGMEMQGKQADLEVKVAGAKAELDKKEKEAQIAEEVAEGKLETARAQLAIDREELEIKRQELELEREELEVKREEIRTKKAEAKAKAEISK